VPGNLPPIGDARRAALAGAAFAALVTLPGLGIGTLWDNSETAYGEVAREVLLYRDPVLLHFNGAPWFVQPPLYFWIAALFAKLFGLGSFALRLPSALATIAAGACVGALTARAAGLRTGVFAGVILSASLMQAVLGRLAVMDALLDLCVTLTILAWYLALAAEPACARRGAAFAAGWIAAAFGVLAKGPVAVVIPALVVGCWCCWERRGRALRVPPLPVWLLSLSFFAAIAFPWFVLVQGRAGGPALADLIGHYSFGRFLGTIENQRGPWYYYLPVIVLGFFPWTAFLVPAVAGALRPRAEPLGGLVRLALCWAAAPLVFFSLAQTKLPNYVALELPALAILVAVWFDGVARGAERRSALLAASAVPLTVAAFAVAVPIFTRDNRLAVPPELGAGLMLLCLIAGAGSLATFALLARRPAGAFAVPVLGATSAALILAIAFILVPGAEALKPIPPLAAVIRRERRSGDTVAIESARGNNALIFYTAPRVVALVSDAAPADPASDPLRVICAAERAFVIGGRDPRGPLPAYGRSRHTLAVAGDDVLYLYDGPRCRRTGALRPPPRRADRK
jgi:4-amino-4-deoxy-L-arabinose transferase-like glycosyltransferase